jgi:hypothetical protein
MDHTASLDKEDRMPFESSVCVKTGDNTKREVKSVRGASEVLIDWPHARRGPVYQATMEVLQAALSGKASSDDAHDAFVAFAKHAGVFVDA